MNAAAAAERAAREEYGRLLAILARRFGDVHLAEDALADAFAAALVTWPRDGVPDAPGAWLITTAQRRAIDRVRRNQRFATVEPLLAESVLSQADEHDERLALMFACAHPAIDERVRAPLIVQTLLGLDAERIASAFLVAPATMSQRLVRAKRKIAEARIPLAIPPPESLNERLDAVLDALYLAFGTGWDDPLGVDGLRGLADEAMVLAEVVVTQIADPEALGLLALMRYAHARRDARRGEDGAFIPLSLQDPARWHLAELVQAERDLRAAARHGNPGRFQLHAAIQSVHVARAKTGTTDWAALAMLYAALEAIAPGIVVRVNRAAALAQGGDARAALALLDTLHDDPRTASYQPYWAALADAAARAGETDRAVAAYDRAIGLASDPAARAFLAARRAAMQPGMVRRRS